MSWDEFGRRRRAIDAVLAHAERYPAAGLPFEQLPAVRAVFASRAEIQSWAKRRAEIRIPGGAGGPTPKFAAPHRDRIAVLLPAALPVRV